jgi:exodeoxyribonuclease-5
VSENAQQQPPLSAPLFAARVKASLPFAPNEQQSALIDALARFCGPERIATDRTRPSADPAFILNGYAGTGKTSLTAALVSVLSQLNIKTVLMAPTGRAAKVLGSFANAPASTIHRGIYRHSLDGGTPPLKANTANDAVFIVDEASMIGGDAPDGTSLLRDLIMYVFSGQNNRLILIGDTAQLPPVGLQESPAMSPASLAQYGLKVSRATLTAIARQQAMSGILVNATMLRNVLRKAPDTPPMLITDGYPDVKVVGNEDLPEEIDSAYRRDGIENTLVITRSNMRATGFNRAIRSEVLYIEQEIAAGDMMLISKNNYFWTRSIKDLDFIANGDIVSVDKVFGSEVKYGFRFADVRFTLIDREISFEAKMMIETLYNDSGALPRDRMVTLYEAIMRDDEFFGADTPYEMRYRKLSQNPYWNALQIKYAYAVTCHKAQGGQWDNVFVDMTYISPEAVDQEFYRWLYTAVTRAKRRIYIIDPSSVM